MDLSLYNLAPTSTPSKHESRKSLHSFNPKAKASTSANGLLTASSAEPKGATSLAISFSSPNLTTNTSFSSSSESEFEQIEHLGANGDTLTKINHFLEIEDASSVDENDANEDEGISGENDVEYAELTQRMIPPALVQKNSQTSQHRGEDQEMGIVDEMMMLSLFDDSTSNLENVGQRASTSSSSSSSTKSARNPVTSANILESLLEPGKGGLTSALSIYNNNLDNLKHFEKIDGNCASGEFVFFF